MPLIWHELYFDATCCVFWNVIGMTVSVLWNAIDLTVSVLWNAIGMTCSVLKCHWCDLHCTMYLEMAPIGNCCTLKCDICHCHTVYTVLWFENEMPLACTNNYTVIWNASAFATHVVCYLCYEKNLLTQCFYWTIITGDFLFLLNHNYRWILYSPLGSSGVQTCFSKVQLFGVSPMFPDWSPVILK